MNLVFVNEAHPDVPHVSSMRMYYFAKAMSARGHRVVLLTADSPKAPGVGLNAADVPAVIASHDWSSPLVVPVPIVDAPRTVEEATLPSPVRRARTAWRLAAGNGVHGGWVVNVDPVARAAATALHPDLAWATFGNTSNLLVAQTLARRARCAWVADIKDNWEAFIPRGLRRAVAWRFRDAAALTANARFHLDVARPWFHGKASRVVYSGVADAFYAAREGASGPGDVRTIVLVGSVYSGAILGDFMAALRRWSQLNPRIAIRLLYAGGDMGSVREAAQAAGLAAITEVAGYVQVSELARLLRGAVAACYLWCETTFHHKLLELLVTGTPIICYPGEQPESIDLAARSSTPFHVCRTTAELLGAFDVAMKSPRLPRDLMQPPAWRWTDMVVGLEAFFADIVAKRVATCAA